MAGREYDLDALLPPLATVKIGGKRYKVRTDVTIKERLRINQVGRRLQTVETDEEAEEALNDAQRLVMGFIREYSPKADFVDFTETQLAEMLYIIGGGDGAATLAEAVAGDGAQVTDQPAGDDPLRSSSGSSAGSSGSAPSTGGRRTTGKRSAGARSSPTRRKRASV